MGFSVAMCAGAATWLAILIGGWTLNRPFAEIEWLERTFAVPDTRPMSRSDISAANRRHDEMVSPVAAVWDLLPLTRLTA
jgi:hypothetical protein